MQKRYFNKPPLQEPSTPKDALKALNILFYALVAGMFLFAALFFGMGFIIEPVFVEKNVVNGLFIAVLFLSTLLLTLAEKRYKKIVADAGQPELSLSLMEKLTRYRAALIFYLAACEGPGLFSIILYMLTGQKLFLAVTALLIIGMFLKKPDKSRIISHLHLSSEEQMQFT
jgi:hypothetical protein